MSRIITRVLTEKLEHLAAQMQLTIVDHSVVVVDQDAAKKAMIGEKWILFCKNDWIEAEN